MKNSFKIIMLAALSMSALVHAGNPQPITQAMITNLNRAAYNKNIDGVNALIKQAGSNAKTLVNATDQWGNIPLISAVTTTDLSAKVVEALLNAGANPNVTDSQGVPALFYVIDNNSIGFCADSANAVRAFITAGVNLNVTRPNTSITPLSQAQQTLQNLIARDNNPSTKYKHPWLIKAAQKIVTELQNAGAQ